MGQILDGTAQSGFLLPGIAHVNFAVPSLNPCFLLKIIALFQEIGGMSDYRGESHSSRQVMKMLYVYVVL